jgi:diamine N-acetyltransferase
VKQYLENAQQDIYEAKQLRLAICQDEDFPAVGLMIYLTLIQKTIGQGWVSIQGHDNRKKNIGSEALGLLINIRLTTLIYINCMQI